MAAMSDMQFLIGDAVREAGFSPVPDRIEVTYLQDPSAALRWHYGPVAGDPDPGKMWCYGCGSEVWTLEAGYICRGCGKQPEE